MYVVIMYTLTFAFPPDSTLTVQNVTRALRGMPYDRDFSNSLGVPDPILGVIERRYSTDDQRNLAVVEHYLRYAPGASWNHLAGELYYWENEGALQQVQRYVQKPAGMTSLLVTCSSIPINYRNPKQSFFSGHFMVCRIVHMFVSCMSYTCNVFKWNIIAILGLTIAPHLHVCTGGLGLNMCSEVVRPRGLHC